MEREKGFRVEDTATKEHGDELRSHRTSVCRRFPSGAMDRIDPWG